MFLKNKNIIFKIRRSKVTDYAALNIDFAHCLSSCCILASLIYLQFIWASTYYFTTYHISDQPRLRQACTVTPELFLLAYMEDDEDSGQIKANSVPLYSCAHLFDK